MGNSKEYKIIISSGDLADDHLVAEIYNMGGGYITSVCSNGKEVVLDFTCEANNDVCKDRKITLANFMESLKESLPALKLSHQPGPNDLVHIKDADKYYNEIWDNIKKHVPEFLPISDRDDGAYMVTHEFCEFLIEQFNNEDIKQRTFNFINEAIEIGGSKTEELIAVQVFELFYLEEKLQHDIRSRLSDKARLIFDEYYEQFRKWH